MFLSETHLPHVLTPDRYRSADQHARELDALFRSAWHWVAQASEFPRDGDFKTFELNGLPIILWRSQDELHAFLNVCPHRHSLLSGQPCGTMKPLQCQYHGWQFDSSGQTRKIPDAPSFKPLKGMQLGLIKFRVERRGDLLFLCTLDDAPPLDESLGHCESFVSDWFPPESPAVLKTDDPVPANWKVVMENAIEGYHVESVHPHTFGKIAPEERCEHEFGRNWSLYTERISLSSRDRRLHRWLGIDVDDRYRIYHGYPNLLFGQMAFFRWVFTVIPQSPTESRLITHMVCRPPHPGRPDQRVLIRLIRRWGQRFFRRVMDEDLGIMGSIQRGLNAPRHAAGGLISKREERLFHFQDYVSAATASDPPTHSPQTRP